MSSVTVGLGLDFAIQIQVQMISDLPRALEAGCCQIGCGVILIETRTGMCNGVRSVHSSLRQDIEGIVILRIIVRGLHHQIRLGSLR